MENGSQAVDPSLQYLQMKVEGANQLELIIILYEGAIKFLNQAKLFFEAKKYDQRCDALINAQEVIRELRNSLDMSIKEISPRLKSLYDYMINRLIESNVQKKVEYIDEVLKMLTELKDVWAVINKKEIVQQSSFQKPSDINLSITA